MEVKRKPSFVIRQKKVNVAFWGREVRSKLGGSFMSYSIKIKGFYLDKQTNEWKDNEMIDLSALKFLNSEEFGNILKAKIEEFESNNKLDKTDSYREQEEVTFSNPVPSLNVDDDEIPF